MFWAHTYAAKRLGVDVESEECFVPFKRKKRSSRDKIPSIKSVGNISADRRF